MAAISAPYTTSFPIHLSVLYHPCFYQSHYLLNISFSSAAFSTTKKVGWTRATGHTHCEIIMKCRHLWGECSDDLRRRLLFWFAVRSVVKSACNSAIQTQTEHRIMAIRGMGQGNGSQKRRAWDDKLICNIQ